MKNILLVDDFQSNLLLIKNILSDDYNVTTATSGEQAMKILRTKRIDLLVLDIWMPGLDGLETLKKIRENSKVKDVPVVLLTGQADRSNILRGHQLGVMDVLAKPVLPGLMKERLQRVFALTENKKEKEESNKAEDAENKKDRKKLLEKQKQQGKSMADEKQAAVLIERPAATAEAKKAPEKDIASNPVPVSPVTSSKEQGSLTGGTKAADKKAADNKAAGAKAESPKAESPKAESPKAESPKAENPKAENPKAESSKVENQKTVEGLAKQSNTTLQKAVPPKTVDPKELLKDMVDIR